MFGSGHQNLGCGWKACCVLLPSHSSGMGGEVGVGGVTLPRGGVTFPLSCLGQRSCFHWCESEPRCAFRLTWKAAASISPPLFALSGYKRKGQRRGDHVLECVQTQSALKKRCVFFDLPNFQVYTLYTPNDQNYLLSIWFLCGSHAIILPGHCRTMLALGAHLGLLISLPLFICASDD